MFKIPRHILERKKNETAIAEIVAFCIISFYLFRKKYNRRSIRACGSCPWGYTLVYRRSIGVYPLSFPVLNFFSSRGGHYSASGQTGSISRIFPRGIQQNWPGISHEKPVTLWTSRVDRTKRVTQWTNAPLERAFLKVTFGATYKEARLSIQNSRKFPINRPAKYFWKTF